MIWNSALRPIRLWFRRNLRTSIQSRSAADSGATKRVVVDHKRGRQLVASASILMLCAGAFAAVDLRLTDANPTAMPEVGSHGLRVISPTLLELTLITTKEPSPAGVTQWNFVGDNFAPKLPAATEFAVTANSQPVSVKAVGFKRRPLYAPLKKRDLRIANHLYLELSGPVSDGQTVEVRNPSAALWNTSQQFRAVMDPIRFSPAIHVNQVGYAPAHPKKAMVGFYLGSFGELKVNAAAGFRIINATSGAIAFQGTLTARADRGYTYSPTPYQQVFEADFSSFRTPGEYRLQVPGLGASYAFMIDDGTLAAFTRTYASGLYHQRCGMENALPFTRHVHDECHVAPADVPTMTFQKVNEFLAGVTSDYSNEPRHTAPRLADVNSSLYPYAKQGKVDVAGGHHDAGDYSKYTINSAQLIHYLVFAADSFPGAGALDNFGIPESGDGKSDLLQEAKWEADFLAKMQDSDGGFYFLVYPRDRKYEDDVLPDKSDPQVVWPKTTAVTAAAVAALAETASSPLFKQQFPAEAALYLQKAQLGWTFLETALARFGKDGAYQKITHYGNEFMHDDELAWAAAAMFAATGDPVFHDKLKSWFDPANPNTRRWSWWRLYEGYGCAARTYAFAVRSGRRLPGTLDAAYLAKCEAEVIAAAEDHVRFARESAYGTSFPDLNKQYRSAGWYFSSERAFDITTAYQLSPKPEYLEAVISNLNYEAGCNPVDVSYVTGLGWKRQRDIVHQYAQNDHRALPPTGIPLGNVQSGFPWLYNYGSELGGLSYPPDGASTAPYPYYDRWGDTFNTTTEFVVVDQARSLASLSFWMAQSSIKTQPWKAIAAQITGLPSIIPADQSMTATLVAPGLDLSNAHVVWEARDQQPTPGATFTFAASKPGDQWVEVEAQLPDGRRVFAATNFTASISASVPPNAFRSEPVSVTPEMLALFHMETLSDATGRHGSLTLNGSAFLDESNTGWMTTRSGKALRVLDVQDNAQLALSSADLGIANTTGISLEAMVYIQGFKAYNRGNFALVSLSEGWNSTIQLMEDAYSGPHIKGGTAWDFTGTELKNALPLNQWHHMRIRLDKTGYTFSVNGTVVASLASAELYNWGKGGPVTLELGNFDGWIDEVVVISGGTSGVSTVNTPTLTPNGGSFSGGATVTIATATEGATIRYTTDGSEPTATSTAFGDALTLSTSATIKARAFKAGMADSGVATATFTISQQNGQTAKTGFVKSDTRTKGDWKGVYGGEGYNVIGSGASYSVPVSVTASGASSYVWSDTTTEGRALLKPTTPGRIAACWNAPSEFNVTLSFADTRNHRVSLYFLDWDRLGRAQTVEFIDAASGVVLNRQTVSSFQEGKYLSWDVKGNVRVRITKVSGPNAVLMGVFIDERPGSANNETTELLGVVTLLGRSAAGDSTLGISGDIGQTFQIETSSNLTTWEPLTVQTLDGTTAEIVDTSARNEPIRFYRAIAIP